MQINVRTELVDDVIKLKWRIQCFCKGDSL